MLKRNFRNCHYLVTTFIIALMICFIWGLGEYAIDSYITHKVNQEVQIEMEIINSNYENTIKSLNREIKAKNYHIILKQEERERIINYLTDEIDSLKSEIATKNNTVY